MRMLQMGLFLLLGLVLAGEQPLFAQETLDTEQPAAEQTDAGDQEKQPEEYPGIKRPYYSATGVYSRIVLFNTYRHTPNPAMQFTDPIAKYPLELLWDEPHQGIQDHVRNPNMWPWRHPFRTYSWPIPYGHGVATPGFHLPTWHFTIDWKSYAPHQLIDFLQRQEKAAEINHVILNWPEMNKQGLSVDWKEHSWRQLHDMKKRLELARCLADEGVEVDPRRYTPTQLTNMLTRVKKAQELAALGCKVNWRLYSWRQLNALWLRALDSGTLAKAE